MKNSNPIYRITYLILFFAGFVSSVMAQNYSVQSGNWDEASTWSLGVPDTVSSWGGWTTDEDVVITSGTIVVLTKDITFGWGRTLTIEEGAVLTGDYNINISLGGSFINNGTASTKDISIAFWATLVNNGEIDAEDLIIRQGGQFENNGETVAENATFEGGGWFSSNIQNEGEITVEEVLVNNSTNISGDGTYYAGTLSGNQPLPEGSEVNNRWTGVTNTKWEEESNWITGVLPSSLDTVSIGSNITNFPKINSAQNIAGIIITDGSELTIKQKGKLTIENTLKNDGELIIKSTNRRKTGGLIAGGKSGSGTVRVERYIPDELSGDDWHTISSPITGIDLASFAANSQVYYSTQYGDYDLAPYNTTSGTWGPYVKNGAGNFVLGRGYSMRRVENPTSYVIIFSGSMSSLNIGNVGPISISYGLNGWNAMGNPFPSAINIESFLDDNSGAIYEEPYDAAYLWDPGTSDFSGKRTGDIALGQGFLIKSKSGGGSINFNTSMQIQNLPVFKSAEIGSPTVHLWVTSNNLKNTTKVIFNEGMTNGLDYKYDIGKFKGNPDIALYTRMPDNSAYDLQDQALPQIAFETITIPVGLDLIPGGEVSFSIETESFPEDVQVLIEDIETDSITLFSTEDTIYTTNVVAENYGTGRFNLIIKKQTTTGIDLEIENQFTVHTQNKIIFISGPANKEMKMELYSIDGKCWYKGKAQDQNLNRIDGTGFPAGVYLLKLNNLGRVQSSKFILTEN